LKIFFGLMLFPADDERYPVADWL